jgi:hypothetical protein
MRQMRTVLGFTALVILAGCAGGSKWGFLRSPQPQDTVTGPPPTAVALVSYLNDNARRIQSVQCRELDLDCREGVRAFGLHGKLVCQKPHRFRMGAFAAGQQQVDVGSNDQEFWYWIPKSDPPYQFHCAYADFERGNAQMPFPFQPEWIMEALGMGEYGAPENFQVVDRGGNYELVESVTSPRGERLRKVTVFTKNRVQGTMPQVTAHILQDANGKEICGAYITEIQQDRATYAVLPRRIRLVWPQQQIELKLKLDDVTVNGPIEAQQAAVLFTRPHLHNVEAFDLARDEYIAPGRIRRAGAMYGPTR